MKKIGMVLSLLLAMALPSTSAEPSYRVTMPLGGTWEFEQTQTAFPPARFTRTIPVPGLIHLASPPIEQFDRLLTAKYEPRYNWYRTTVSVPADLQGSHAVLTILKSQFVTQAYVNGFDMGGSMACYTPIDLPVTHALRFGGDNEILVRVGDRAWLPSAAAGSTDKEKVAYVPGIWDEVNLSFSGPVRLHRLLVLPNLKEEQITVKSLVRSFHPAQVQYGDTMEDAGRARIIVREKSSGKVVAEQEADLPKIKRDNLTETSQNLSLPHPHPWNLEDPFLYTAEMQIFENNVLSDRIEVTFGMRDFGRNGKQFTLNGRPIILRGTNITLHRFFEDPDCADLPWDRAWAHRLLNVIPKVLHWNAMRVCVGIAPSFWYDLADEAGLMFQNEWLYWQNHGWDEQIRQEYTDWVWADGNHPSIVIWDAINENWDAFIGNVLIPDLKQLDPTRMWDAGYMTSEQMKMDEMDEPHPYRVYGMQKDFAEYFTQHPYALGRLSDDSPDWQRVIHASSPQLVNEYGWMWLWRDGRPAKLTENNYAFYVGEKATPEERRVLQAYWLQLETEWLRAERSLAGVLCFCYLTNNYGFTGDWFIGPIRTLESGPSLQWLAHAFAPAAVFIDLQDERYNRSLPPHPPGSPLLFNLVAVNDRETPVQGTCELKLLDAAGGVAFVQTVEIKLPAHEKSITQRMISLPSTKGGYLLLAEFSESGQGSKRPVISRRYLKVGELDRYLYYEVHPDPVP